LEKGGIAPRFIAPGGSSNLQSHVLPVGSIPKFPLHFADRRSPSNTVCHWSDKTTQVGKSFTFLATWRDRSRCYKPRLLLYSQKRMGALWAPR